jgi:hypothetical protein
MLSGSSWASIYASHQSAVGPESWWESSSTLSWLLYCTTCNFFSIDLSQSSAFIGSTTLEKVGGLVRWKSPILSLGGGGGAWGWAYRLTMVCCMVWSIWTCIVSTYSRVGGGVSIHGVSTHPHCFHSWRVQCPQSPQEVASMLTIVVGLHSHSVPSRRCVNVLPYRKLPCHLEKKRKTRVNNHLN